MPLTTFDTVGILVTGLVAGLFGGLLGVGGSIIMIPALVAFFGQGHRPGYAGFNQHLYQAAAMIVNIAVAIPATIRHTRAGAVVPRVVRSMLPAALLGVVAGVWLSNARAFREGMADTPGPVLLGRVMAVFLLYVIVMNIARMFRRARDPHAPLILRHVSSGRCTGVGLAMGLVAGLLGVGGGALAVPLQQVVLKLRLRNCIANSAAVMCFTALVGAVYKNLSLPQHGLAIDRSLLLAALFIPPAVIAAWAGSHLTHRLPVRLVRGVFILALAASAWKMAGFGSPPPPDRLAGPTPPTVSLTADSKRPAPPPPRPRL